MRARTEAFGWPWRSPRRRLRQRAERRVRRDPMPARDTVIITPYRATGTGPYTLRVREFEGAPGADDK